MSLGNRLSTKLLFALCSVITVALGILILVVSQQSSRVAEAQAQQIATEMAERYASRINAQLDSAILPVRTLAQAFATQKEAGVTDRRNTVAILKRVLDESPGLLGIWTVWEPNAYDGLDAKFANTPGTDASGRFIPYWNRASTDGAQAFRSPCGRGSVDAPFSRSAWMRFSRKGEKCPAYFSWSAARRQSCALKTWSLH